MALSASLNSSTSGMRLLLGFVAGFGAGLIFHQIGLGLLLSFGAALAFPHIPAIGNLVSFRPSIELIAPVLAAAFVLCVLGSLFPAWRAARMLPAEALRRI